MRSKIDRTPSKFLTDIMEIKQRVDNKLEEIHQTLTSDPEPEDDEYFRPKFKEIA